MIESTRISRAISPAPGSSTTTIVHVDGKPYLLHPVVFATLGPLAGEGEFIPTTYLGSAELNCQGVSDEFQERIEKDDVWSRGFLSLVIHAGSDASTIEGIKSKFLDASLFGVPGGLPISSGPYVLHAATGRLYAVFRLFEDHNNAFVRGVIPWQPGARFRWFEASDLIPVPSRLYSSNATDERPLLGLRFAVKDNIDIAGLQTGNGSKDFRALYSARESSAACIQWLLMAGAVMVGKLRCTQWCDGQDPLERLEEITPTNPRGDGWQKPSSSSSGSAAACASYAWLDFTVGSDTGGSIRHPAAVNGLFGIRPSLGAVQSSSSLVCYPEFDTIGVFTRSASMANTVTRILMSGIDGGRGGSGGEKLVVRGGKPGFTLLYASEGSENARGTAPKFFPDPGCKDDKPEFPSSAAAVFESFVTRLENHLGTSRQQINLYDDWRRTGPQPSGEDLDTYTGNIYRDLVYGFMARDVIGPFVADFQRAHPDRGRPFIEPMTKARLEFGASVSDEEMDRAREALAVFRDWVNSRVLPGSIGGSWMADGRREHEGIPLLVYPQVWGQPQYRDDAPRAGPSKIFFEGFSVYSISYGSGCPDYVVPLGEVEFTSRITGSKARLPVAISMLVPRGMDHLLLDLIQELEEVGILSEVIVGNKLYK